MHTLRDGSSNRFVTAIIALIAAATRPQLFQQQLRRLAAGRSHVAVAIISLNHLFILFINQQNMSYMYIKALAWGVTCPLLTSPVSLLLRKEITN